MPVPEEHRGSWWEEAGRGFHQHNPGTWLLCCLSPCLGPGVCLVGREVTDNVALSLVVSTQVVLVTMEMTKYRLGKDDAFFINMQLRSPGAVPCNVWFRQTTAT